MGHLGAVDSPRGIRSPGLELADHPSTAAKPGRRSDRTAVRRSKQDPARTIHERGPRLKTRCQSVSGPERVNQLSELAACHMTNCLLVAQPSERGQMWPKDPRSISRHECETRRGGYRVRTLNPPGSCTLEVL